MYTLGRGVPQDDLEGVGWYRRAAEQGDAFSQNMVGSMYLEGRGVAQDWAQAASWYRRAAEQGDAAGQFNLGALYADGSGVQQDNVVAYTWITLSAAQSSENRENYSETRDILAALMSREEITEAQRRAREWTPTPGAPTPEP